MHGEIRAALEHRALDLLDEETLAADVGKRPILNAIALRRDRHELNRMPQALQLRGDPVRLPTR